jgi:hypothetical protein
MADCECLKGCIFFNNKMVVSMPAMSDAIKERYCRGDCSECARYVVFKALGKEKVPPNMFPIDLERAKKILAGKE